MRQHTIPLPQEEKERAHRGWQVAAILAGALLIVVLLVWVVPAPVSAPVAIADTQHLNPELRYVERYALEAARRAEMMSVAINPELNTYYRYTAAAAVPSLAENPELMAAAHYTALQAARQEAAFLAANPEVRSFQRYQLEHGR